jgi:hypothetical protein
MIIRRKFWYVLSVRCLPTAAITSGQWTLISIVIILPFTLSLTLSFLSHMICLPTTYPSSHTWYAAFPHTAAITSYLAFIISDDEGVLPLSHTVYYAFHRHWSNNATAAITKCAPPYHLAWWNASSSLLISFLSYYLCRILLPHYSRKCTLISTISFVL